VPTTSTCTVAWARFCSTLDEVVGKFVPSPFNTGQALDNQHTTLAGEQRFERARNTTGFVLGPLVFISLWLAPLPGLAVEGHRLAAVMGLVVVFWLTEPIPIAVTAILGPVLCILVGVAPAKEVLPNFGDPLILLFLGGFVIAKAMQVHGVSQRFAIMILAQPFIASSPYRVMFALGAVTAVLSMWISNTATAAMMFPIGLGILAALSGSAGSRDGSAATTSQLARTRFGTGMMLLVAYSSSIGGLATPVGSPPNLIGMGALEKLANVKVSFFQWMAFGLPASVALYLVLYLYLSRVCPPRWAAGDDSTKFVTEELRKLGGWSRGQINTVLAFLITVVLWVTPGVAALVSGTGSPAHRWCERHIPESAAALVGGVLLFLLPVNWRQRTFTITVKQAFEIDWGTLLLFGGGLALGEQMFRTGLASTLGTTLVEMTGAHSLLAITALAVGLAILLTETTSNTASANMVVPVMIAIAVTAGVNPVPPALGAALGSSMAFLLPVSTPPNAIVYSSGLVPITKMVRYGFVMSVACFVIITLTARYLVPLVGFSAIPAP
jgi:sodium-dependent dicarboxylate transporter 2/3/5